MPATTVDDAAHSTIRPALIITDATTSRRWPSMRPATPSITINSPEPTSGIGANAARMNGNSDGPSSTQAASAVVAAHGSAHRPIIVKPSRTTTSPRTSAGTSASVASPTASTRNGSAVR